MQSDKLTELFLDVMLSAIGLSVLNVTLSKYVTWLFDFVLYVSDKL